MEATEVIKIIEETHQTYDGDTKVLLTVMKKIKALQDRQLRGEMTMLGDRNYALISEALKCEGSFDPSRILFIFEERLYIHEGEMIEEFLQWVVDGEFKEIHGSYQPIRGFGHGNYEERFQEFLKSR